MPDELARLAGAPGNSGRSRSNARQLLLVHRIVGLLGAGQVAHDQTQVERVEVGAGEALELVFGEAQAAHAGVDLERGRQPLLAGAGERGVAARARPGG